MYCGFSMCFLLLLLLLLLLVALCGCPPLQRDSWGTLMFPLILAQTSCWTETWVGDWTRCEFHVTSLQWFVCTCMSFYEKRTYHFKIKINYILSSSCTSNVVCVYKYVYLHKRAYHFQIEINYILLSSCTSNVVCVYSMSIYTKGTYHFQIEINYILSPSCTFNVVCVYKYVYLHKGRIISK